MKRLLSFLLFAFSFLSGVAYAQQLPLEERVSQLEKAVNQLILLNYEMAKKIREIENYLGISKEDRLLGKEGVKIKKSQSSDKNRFSGEVGSKVKGPVIIATLVSPQKTLKKWIASGFLSTLQEKLPQARYFVSLKKKYVVIFLPKGEEVPVSTLTSLGFTPPYLKVKKLSVKGKPLSSLVSLLSQSQQFQGEGGVKGE